MEEDVGSTLGNVIINLHGGHTLLPIENQIGVVYMKIKVRWCIVKPILSCMTTAWTIRNAGDAIRRCIVDIVWFQRRKCVEQRNDANARIRLGCDGGIGRITLTVGAERDNRH